MAEEIQESKRTGAGWKKWGAYLSERSWGTVREDYSKTGDAWNYLTHDMARSKAYRWGEDGIAGFSDYFQTVAFSFAFWNGKDPILKERLFGLTPLEGNHGEDVKECYYYIDATPSQSYMKMLYKYPQNEFPYDELVKENKRRTSLDREFEISDTGAFEKGRYFDIFIEYAKAEEEDICVKVEVWNRGDEKAILHILPQLLFRNRWSWGDSLGEVPTISLEKAQNHVALLAKPYEIPYPVKDSIEYSVPLMRLYAPTPKEALFTHNETHNERVWGSTTKSRTPYVKDAFHRYIIEKEPCISPDNQGSKSCLHYEVTVDPNSSFELFLRLTSKELLNPFEDTAAVIALRKQEADTFYESIQHKTLSKEDKRIQRTALAGMIWSQQLYIYDVKRWLLGDSEKMPPPSGRGKIRNGRWAHLYAADVISMPDKWEYPWFASWDLAFQSVAISLVDITLAKEQISLLLRHWFQHVNGQIPAYEWSFSDLNPPVQAWALWKIYLREQETQGKGDYQFLLFGFLKLVQNFSWWVNKVDRFGNNCFEGGFLGLDNISVIDRSDPLPDGKVIEQSDATGWMGLYSLIMMRIALELAKENPCYESLATDFFENFIYISDTMHQVKGMWDDADGFFYDVILDTSGKVEPLKIRSFVGLIPFYSLIFMSETELNAHKNFRARLVEFQKRNQEKVNRCFFKVGDNWVFSLINEEQIKKILTKAFDPEEFLSDHGLRSISKFHEKNPLIFGSSIVKYEPGESLEKIKGGNSNWRGPIWIPTNYLFLDSLHKLKIIYGENYRIEDSGKVETLGILHTRLKENLVSLFRQNAAGSRPIHGDSTFYQKDPSWKDLLLFYEHYHGDTGRGLGASHQTGWSGLIANIIDQL